MKMTWQKLKRKPGVGHGENRGLRMEMEGPSTLCAQIFILNFCSAQTFPFCFLFPTRRLPLASGQFRR